MEENNMEVIEKMIEPLAWDKLSEDFGWTEELLEKCRDQVNWQKISQNNNIAWNTSMLEKFKDELDWNELSGYGDTRLFTMEHLERFKEYWNWSSLSGNGSINWSRTLLERFADSMGLGKDYQQLATIRQIVLFGVYEPLSEVYTIRGIEEFQFGGKTGERA